MPFVSSESSAEATLTNVAMTNNYGADGGCMSTYAESSNKLTLDCINCDLSYCKASDKGGALYHQSLVDVSEDSYISFDSDSTMHNNAALIEGGAIKYTW